MTWTVIDGRYAADTRHPLTVQHQKSIHVLCLSSTAVNLWLNVRLFKRPPLAWFCTLFLSFFFCYHSHSLAGRVSVSAFLFGLLFNFTVFSNFPSLRLFRLVGVRPFHRIFILIWASNFSIIIRCPASTLNEQWWIFNVSSIEARSTGCFALKLSILPKFQFLQSSSGYTVHLHTVYNKKRRARL